MTPRPIALKFFASLREALATADATVPYEPALRTVGDVRELLAARGGAWTRLKTTPNLRCAVNQSMADDRTPVTAGDEVAFFPPVTGG